jgi:carbon-monoxide dehydrogenase small subunit
MADGFRISVNGVDRVVSCPAERSLAQVLRSDLGLTGTKVGCGTGACGSCTVLMGGRPVRSCKVAIGEVDGPITTIEGLERDGRLHPIQQAFIDRGAVQCGFCTPGMVLAAKALLDANPKPTRDEIKKALAGNLCRCTGYQQIFEAVEEAARRMG